MRMFIEFRAGTDLQAAEEACRAAGMTGLRSYTDPDSPNGGPHVEGETERQPEVVRDGVAARMPGAVEFAGTDWAGGLLR